MRKPSSGRGVLTLPWARTLLLALVALSATAGCSWIFRQPLRDDRSPYDYPVCSTNPAPPVIDTAIFILNAGTTIYTAAQDNVSAKALRVAVGTTAAALYLLSAIYGYSKLSECMAAIRSHETGPRRPAFGTGGEVFLEQPPPPSPPRSPQPQPPQHPQQPDEGEDPLHPNLHFRPIPIEKPDAPRFGS
jgi:hypothetical protein